MAKPSNKARRGSDKQVSAAENEAQDKGDTKQTAESQEIWRMVRVLGFENDDILVCRTEQCDKNAVSLWMAGNTAEEWPFCESCQEKQFGGSAHEKEQMLTDSSRSNDDDALSHTPLAAPKQPEEQGKEEKAEEEDEDLVEAEEVWDLKKIMSIEDVTHECPIKCSHEDCPLPAAVAWVSDQKPNSKWYSCLDHQVR